MAHRPVWLAKRRSSRSQRAHFAIFVPNAADATKDPNVRSVPCKGTSIHVVGAPMAGFQHEFKRNDDCGPDQDLETLVQIGWVNSDHVFDPPTDAFSTDDTPMGRLDAEALRVPAPRRSENFMAPVNDVSFSSAARTQDMFWLLTSSDHKQTMSRVDHGLCPPFGRPELHRPWRHSNRTS